jgi:pyruvate dehydrogenase E1 component alpha subunit
MYLIRSAEIAIRQEYQKDEMKTPMHMSMGSEAISAGLCEALGKRAAVFGTYRSHALYLARTEDVDGFFAEMYGKETGPSQGKAGSMHLCNPRLGFMGSSAIVGGILPIAVGYAFSNQYLSRSSPTAVLFGDGATNEGTFWESINLACVKKVPIIFVCEDNGLAVHTKKETRNGFTNLTDIITFFKCMSYKYEGTNVEVIYNIFEECVKNLHLGPCFVHLKYYRYLQHVGVNTDFDKGYRNESEFHCWHSIDPIKMCEKQLLNGCISTETIEGIKEEIDQRVKAGIEFAKNSDFAPTLSIIKGVYYDAYNNVL